MQHVGFAEVIAYGFRLLGLFLIGGIMGGGVGWLGAFLMATGFDEGSFPMGIAGGFVSLLGFLVIMAVLMGVSYKVVADGTMRGGR